MTQLLIPEPQRPQTHSTPAPEGRLFRLGVRKHAYRVKCKCCGTWNWLATRKRVCMVCTLRGESK